MTVKGTTFIEDKWFKTLRGLGRQMCRINAVADQRSWGEYHITVSGSSAPIPSGLVLPEPTTAEEFNAKLAAIRNMLREHGWTLESSEDSWATPEYRPREHRTRDAPG